MFIYEKSHSLEQAYREGRAKQPQNYTRCSLEGVRGGLEGKRDMTPKEKTRSGWQIYESDKKYVWIDKRRKRE